MVLFFNVLRFVVYVDMVVEILLSFWVVFLRCCVRSMILVLSLVVVDEVIEVRLVRVVFVLFLCFCEEFVWVVNVVV